MKPLLMLSASVFALSLGGCEFFSDFEQDCPPGTVMGHCYDDPDPANDVQRPERPTPEPPGDDDDHECDPKGNKGPY